MKIQGLLIGLLVFCLFITGSTLLYTDFQNTYQFDQQGYSPAVFNKLNQTQNLTRSISNNFEGASVSSTDAVTNLVAAGFSTLRLAYSSVGIINSLIKETAVMWGIPTFFVDAGIVIIGMAVIFLILAAIMRWPI